MPGPRYQEWLRRVQGWQAPDQSDMEDEYDSYQGRSTAYVNDMLQKTGAQGLLSQSVINRLKRNASLPYLSQVAQAGGQDANVSPGNFGDYLKNWLQQGTVAGGGASRDVLQNNVQQLLNRYSRGQAASAADATTVDTANPDYQVFTNFNKNRNLLGAMIGALARGPFKDMIQRQMVEALQQEPAAGVGGEDIDWIAYMLSQAGMGKGGGLGLHYNQPKGW